MSDSRHPQAMPPAGQDDPAQAADDHELPTPDPVTGPRRMVARGSIDHADLAATAAAGSAVLGGLTNVSPEPEAVTQAADGLRVGDHAALAAGAVAGAASHGQGHGDQPDDASALAADAGAAAEAAAESADEAAADGERPGDDPWGSEPAFELASDPDPTVDAVLREPPLESVMLARPTTPDVSSLALALGGTFLLRCASYAAGLLVLVSLGIKSRDESNVTAGIASLVAVTFYASELIGAPLFGAWSDRIGRKPFMILGPVFGAIAAQLMGVTMLIPVLVLVRILQGLSTATAAPATLGFLSAQTATSVKLRGRVMGFYEAATVVGLALGAAVGGKLHDQFGSIAFSVVALLYVVALVPFLLVKDRVWVPKVAHDHGNVVRRMFNRRILRFAPAWLAANAVLGAWFSVGPFLASGAPNRGQFLMRGFSAGEIGVAYLVFGILFTAGAITWGFVMPMIGRQATLLSGVAGLGFTSLALWALNHVPYDTTHTLVPTLVAVVMLGVFVESGFTPAALAYLAEIAEQRAEDRGSVMGVYSVLLSVGQLVGGALAAPFAERMGINGLIILTGLLCLVALFTVMLLGQSEREDDPALAAA